MVSRARKAPAENVNVHFNRLSWSAGGGRRYLVLSEAHLIQELEELFLVVSLLLAFGLLHALLHFLHLHLFELVLVVG